MKTLPTIALLGRPNVGKSTLYNRLTGTRHALVDDRPGVTRDRRAGQGRIGPLHFNVIDTAGLEEAAPDSLPARMTKASLASLSDADCALLVLDGRSGITPQDEAFARALRAMGAKVVPVVNKAESRAEATMSDAWRLGLGEPIAISAAHGEGMAELHDAIMARLGEGVGVIPPEPVREGKSVSKRKAERERLAAQIVAAEERAEAERDSAEPADNGFPLVEGQQARVSPEHASSQGQEDLAGSKLKITILGRPNAGKSTLMNRWLGEERVLTGPEAGITRDAITAETQLAGRAVTLVDTAGMRRRAKVAAKGREAALEQLAVSDALRALRQAEIALLVMDCHQPLDKQDVTLAALAAQEGRAVVLGLNKWDSVPKAQREEWLKAARKLADDRLPQLEGLPLVPFSAETGEGLAKLEEAIFAAHEIWNIRIGTSALNRWLDTMLARHSLPLVDGRRLKLRYVTQAKGRPPTFIIFASKAGELPTAYQRYLIRGLRNDFGFWGVPIRLKLRQGSNPYA